MPITTTIQRLIIIPRGIIVWAEVFSEQFPLTSGGGLQEDCPLGFKARPVELQEFLLDTSLLPPLTSSTSLIR